MSEMSRTERAAIRHWQGEPDLHPLTCGNDSTHQILHEDSGVLRCFDCDYMQEFIPPTVVAFFMEEARAALGIVEPPDEDVETVKSPNRRKLRGIRNNPYGHDTTHHDIDDAFIE